MSYFRRGLSASFLAALKTGGDLHPVIEGALAHGLDLGVRQNYFNLYSGRNSVLKLRQIQRKSEFEVHIHEAYRPPASVAAKRSGKYRVQRFAATAATAWAKAFHAALPALLEAAKEFDKPEGATEFALAVAHRNAPLTVIDRQVQLGDIPDSRVDAFAVLDEGRGPRVLLLELKAGERLDVAAVVEQVDRYRTFYEVDGRLREDVATCLQQVWTQKAAMGFVGAPTPGLDLSRLRVEYLVALSSARPRGLPSEHKPKSGGLVGYVGVAASSPVIPRSTDWEVLRAS